MKRRMGQIHQVKLWKLGRKVQTNLFKIWSLRRLSPSAKAVKQIHQNRGRINLCKLHLRKKIKSFKYRMTRPKILLNPFRQASFRHFRPNVLLLFRQKTPSKNRSILLKKTSPKSQVLKVKNDKVLPKSHHKILEWHRLLPKNQWINLIGI